jgi:hypothetical protein
VGADRPVTLRVASIDGPGHHFGLGRTLNQATTTVAKIVSNVAGTPQTGETATAAPGDVVVFQVNFANINPAGTDIRDFFDPRLLFIGGDGCTEGPAGAPLPAGAPANAGIVTCNVIDTGDSGQMAIQFSVDINATPGASLLNFACAQDSTNGWTVFCDTATITVAAAPSPPPVPTPPVLIPPILPPPPLPPLLPPPSAPPLLPPPPMAPPMMQRPMMPEVPVIPEADSLFLLVGGLVVLGGLAGLRVVRRRDDDEV